MQHASRMMNPAKRGYSACKRKALAVVFALRKFRVYLLSNHPFELITDHRLLEDAFEKKDLHRRLARWLDSLAEYDYVSCYRPGKMKGSAYGLSRLEIDVVP